MNSRLEDLLESAALEPPEGFAARVIASIENLPPPRKTHTSPRWIPWVAVICGLVLSVAELVSFMLSAWITVAAN
jgi:hypothetical protein